MLDREYAVLIAGFGGQGILFAAKTLAQAAVEANLNVTYLPSYGAEMRGGTANATVVLSPEEIPSPIVDELDALIAMNLPSYNKFLPKLKEDGVLVVNASLVPEKERKESHGVFVYCNKIAEDVGNPRGANLVALGAFAKRWGMLAKDFFYKALKKILSSKKDLLELNWKAFTKGWELA